MDTARVKVDQSLREQQWREELWWHRKMYQGARFRWFGSHVMDQLTWLTGGRLEFESVADLGLLVEARERAAAESRSVIISLGHQLRSAALVIEDDQVVADLLGVTIEEHRYVLRISRGTAGGLIRRSPEVTRIYQVLDSQLLRNPLIQALEYTQAWRLHQAVEAMLEDTLCDLLGELGQTRPASVLVSVTGAVSAASLQARVERARKERGGLGDPRRIPEQHLICDERR